jgi:flagellar biosynthesis protein FlhG
MSQTEDPEKNLIFAVGGGKGGIGKTVLSASIGMGLAMLHKDVLLMDSDFGGANLHKALGMESVRESSRLFLERKVTTLEETRVPHPDFENLNFIRGMSGVLGAANLKFLQKQKLIRHISRLSADFVILDLGSGSDFQVLDFFLSADIGIVVVTPDPMSILEGYQFIKQAFFRRLTQDFRQVEGISEIIHRYGTEDTQNRSATSGAMIEEVRAINASAAHEIQETVRQFSPKLLINRLKNSSEENDCMAVIIAAEELLGIDMEYWGAVREDPEVYKALLAGKPFIGYNSKCWASRDLVTLMITKILKQKRVSHWTVKNLQTIDGYHPICSYQCHFWQSCGLKKGGFPCDMVKI